jgi:hypothetical protein
MTASINQKVRKGLLGLFFLGLLLAQAACTPKIYVIDRQTVLEEEAAGSWPDFEKEIIQGAKTSGPTPFQKIPPSQNRARLYNVLNGTVQ